MANEFVARKGLIVSGSTNISGSVTASYFKGDGSQLTNLASTNVSSVIIDNSLFVGDGVTTTYNLGAYYTPTSLMVSVDGMFYTPTSDFTISASSIVFTSAPPSSSDITVRKVLNVATGSVATYSGSFVGDGSGLTNIRSVFGLDTYKFIGNGVTSSYVLSQSNYTNSTTFVSVGGVSYIATEDYNITGNTILFTQAPPSGSLISIRALLSVITGSVGVMSGSLIGTSSYATNALSASYSVTASYALNAAGGGGGSGESFHPFLLAGM